MKNKHFRDPASFLFARYASEDELPLPILQKYFDGCVPTPTTAIVMLVVDVPTMVTEEPGIHQLRDLYPHGHPHDFPSHILCLFVKAKKKWKGLTTQCKKVAWPC